MNFSGYDYHGSTKRHTYHDNGLFDG